MIIPILYIPLGLFFYFGDGSTTGIMFIVSGIIWFFGYPYYSRWKWKKHFIKFVNNDYKNRIDKPIEININTDYIITKDATSESKIVGKEVKTLIETDAHFFAKLSTDMTLIVPKNEISSTSEFIKIFENFGAIHNIETDWKWK